jgi:hypothetical protein
MLAIDLGIPHATFGLKVTTHPRRSAASASGRWKGPPQWPNTNGAATNIIRVASKHNSAIRPLLLIYRKAGEH